MSRQQPPLPPGLPPRPPTGPSDYGRCGDSYRPNDNRYPPPPSDIYRFGGYDSRSQYPPHPNYPGAPRGDSYRPHDSAPGRSPPRGPSGRSDSYRPQESGFNFRFDAPQSIDFHNADRFRRSPPRNFAQQNNASFRQNNRADHPSRGRGGYRGRGGGAPRMASDRAFLKTNRSPTPELMSGMTEEDGNEIKYKAVEELSDSDEAEMEISDGEVANGEAEQPKKKQIRTTAKAADSDSAPRWSNPDPYTALPPPDESQRKKKDVVKLIRKARVQTTSESTSKSEAVTDDFISFDMGGEEEEEEEENDEDDEEFQQGQAGMLNAPTEPRYSHRRSIHHQDDVVITQQSINTSHYSTNFQNGAAVANVLEKTSDPALGNRKRTIRDEIKGPPLVNQSTKGKKPPCNGTVLKEWKPQANMNGTPWLVDHSNSANPGLWLHKEIMDFYHYVKPREFEQVLRSKLLQDLRSKVRAHFRDADILSFGSFPAGLYLPTSDMDIVMVSDKFMRGGNAKYDNRGAIYKFDAFLQKNNIAIQGSIEKIIGAKVPLVKWVDRVTGLKVDLSFENDTGLTAIKTFLDWKTQFPAMPILVTLIKQFLTMRGLNEPVNGGIGGFSMTCLVVSLLQAMPQVQSRSMVPEHHLGEILMEFFDLYGNEFNTVTTAIAFNPPGYIPKSHNHRVVYKNPNAPKFSIMDPNNPANDIAGGSSNTQTITKSFSEAFRALQARMAEMRVANMAERANQSILGCIMAGNYSSFDLQRAHLRHLHEQLFGPVIEE